jgi:Phage tail sheath protein subtilisin-like domain/Phage tail sheath C-terminal domain
MAEKIVSPGVFTRENDQTFLAQGVSAIGATIIAPFSEGPTVPTVVTSLADLETYYGKADDNYYGPLTAKNYLQEAGQVTICRVAGINGYSEAGALLLVYSTGSNATQKALGLLYDTDTDAVSFSTGLAFNGNTGTNSYQGLSVYSASINAGTTTDWGFGLSGSALGVSISASLYGSAANNIKFTFGTSPKGTKEAYTYGFFGATAQSGLFVNAGTAAISGAVLGTQSFAVAAQPAYTPVIQSQLTGGDRTSVLKFYTLGSGEPTNKKVKVSIYNVKPSGIIAGSDYGTFSVLVRAFDDTDKVKVSYESYSNLTLDPSSPNYVLRVIGNRSKTIATTGIVTEYGDYPNVSKYVRCWNEGDTDWVTPEAINATAVPYAHAPYKLMVSASSYWSNLIPAVTYATASSTVFGGIDFDNNEDNKNYMTAIPAGAGTGANTTFSLDTFCNLPLTGSLQNDVNKRRFTIAFQGGFNGVNPTKALNKGADITASNTQGFDVSTTTSEGYTAYLTHINALANADEYDTNLIVTPGLIRELHSTLVDKVLEMVENRGDCFYIIDGVGFSSTIEAANTQAQSLDTNYAAMYYPWVKAVNTVTNKLMAVPPSVLLPAVYAANDRITAEWYAPAGLNRGGLTGAVAVISKLTQNDRDTLYESKVNPIAQFPGQGIVAFGQKTLQDKSSALDRINVRRLLLTVRKYIASASRYLVFEQNTSTTRQRFLNIVNPYLEGIQQRQGLYAFKVQMDEALNTPDMIDRGILKGAIFLQPTRTAEFIVVDFNILPTGAAFNS